MKAMGMDANTWSNILGFYSTYFGIYIVVLMSIYTTSTGTGIISKEEKDRTSEFLLTKPLSRNLIFKSKLCSLGVLTLSVFLIQSIFAFALVTIFGEDVNYSKLAVMQINGLFLILLFTSLGVLISMNVQPKKNFMGIVVGLTFGSYFLNALSKSTDAISWLGYFSPFHYMDFNVTEPNYSVDWLSAVILVIISSITLYISMNQYNKKDIAG
jgi:ABC-2 type transport system permease protein